MSERTTWEYATVPLLTHATKQILDQWGPTLGTVSVLQGPTGEQHVAYLKRAMASRSGGQERSDSGSVTQRLAELGVTLPAVATPLAAYVPAVRTGNLVYTPGQPAGRGEPTHSGKVGAEVTPEEAKIAARTCALNAPAAVDALVGISGGPGRQGRRFRRVGTGFHRSTRVVNGASQFLGEVFGDAGSHARPAVGAASLPRTCRWRSSSSSRFRRPPVTHPLMARCGRSPNRPGPSCHNPARSRWTAPTPGCCGPRMRRDGHRRPGSRRC